MTQVPFNNSKILLIHNQNFAPLESTYCISLHYFRGISHYSTTQTFDAVYIIGGYWSATKDVVAEFKNDQWRRLANLNQKRHAHGSITFEGRTMIIGGYFDSLGLV